MASPVRFIIIVVALILAGVFGWVRGTTPSLELDTNNAGWQTPELPDGGQEKVQQLSKQLLATSYFKDSAEAKAGGGNGVPEIGEAQAAIEKKYGRFPHIICISRIDGQDTAQLRVADNAIQTVHAGDVLESGWVIKEINSDHLVTQAGSERFSFAVFEHNNGQGKNDADQ